MKTAYIYGTLLDGHNNRIDRSIVLIEDGHIVYAGPLENFVQYLDCTTDELEDLVSALRDQGQLASQPAFNAATYPFPIAFHDISGKTIQPGLVITDAPKQESPRECTAAQTNDAEGVCREGIAIVVNEGEIALKASLE